MVAIISAGSTLAGVVITTLSKDAPRVVDCVAVKKSMAELHAAQPDADLKLKSDDEVERKCEINAFVDSLTRQDPPPVTQKLPDGRGSTTTTI